MVKKINFRFVLFCIIVLMLAVAVSCAKKTPEPEEERDRDQEISESQEAAEEEERQREADRQESEIDEQELEDRKRAEAEEQQESEEEAKELFLSEKVYFEFDDSSLNSEAREVLQRKVKWLRQHPDACVIIEGHCDERGTDEYNLALGSRRAESVKDFLVKAGIDGSQITTISYGEERPAAEGQNEEAWAKNRRAEFRFCR